jgi:hypothetical protein
MKVQQMTGLPALRVAIIPALKRNTAKHGLKSPGRFAQDKPFMFVLRLLRDCLIQRIERLLNHSADHLMRCSFNLLHPLPKVLTGMITYGTDQFRDEILHKV